MEPIDQFGWRTILSYEHCIKMLSVRKIKIVIYCQRDPCVDVYIQTKNGWNNSGTCHFPYY